MPRSPSRDLSDRFNTHRDYFHQPGRVVRWKYALSAVALVGAVAWAVFDRVSPTQAAITHTHGTLSNPHSIWDNQCEACHKPSSVNDFSLSSMLTGTSQRWRELTCDKCHAQGGPIHHATAVPFHMQTDCASCHHDHQGRLNSMTVLSDKHCTSCHGNLDAHHASGQPQPMNSIPSFAKHPEFGPVAKFDVDRERKIRFSHARHMIPGMAAVEGGKPLRTLEDPKLARYALPGQSPKDAVTLECQSCHQLDSGTSAAKFDGGKFDASWDALSGQPRRSILPPRAEGAYFLPINFEQHCKACHQDQLKAPETQTGAGDSKIALEAFDVPHRLPTDRLKDVLEGEYSRRLLQKDPKHIAALSGPGGRLDPPQDTPAAAEFRAERDRLVNAAFKYLIAPETKTGCTECHLARGESDHLAIEPIPDHTVWFGHSKFNHVSHRGVACAECHPGTGKAFVPSGKDWIEQEPLAILGVESCRKCHAPAGTKDGLPTGGVRHGCTDCHRFHNGDQPLQGLGARARDPNKPATVGEFLRGNKP